MYYAEPLSSRMPLSPQQHSHIAAAYDKAAFDIGFPARTRAAFAKKADWFRLLARVGEKKLAAIQQSEGPQPNPFGFIAGNLQSRLEPPLPV
jgi:hypothetical protein